MDYIGPVRQPGSQTMSQTPHHHARRWWLAPLAVILLGGCVYRVDVQQGNLLDQDDIDQVEVGMTRSQVRFLLGTPVVRDSFQLDRWDYVYTFRQGRSREVERSWLVIHFDGDVVSRIEPDAQLEPRRAGLF
jgi:outer membrane protein assembly factor BamE